MCADIREVNGSNLKPGPWDVLYAGVRCQSFDGFSRKVIHWDIRPEMKELDIEAIIQYAKEQYPEARPRIISDNGP